MHQQKDILLADRASALLSPANPDPASAPQLVRRVGNGLGETHHQSAPPSLKRSYGKSPTTFSAWSTTRRAN